MGFGAIVIVAGDVSVHATGVVLAFSAGVYIYIAAAECIPQIQEFDESLANHISRSKRSFYQLLSVFCFICGAVPIGLVLINHSRLRVKTRGVLFTHRKRNEWW